MVTINRLGFVVTVVCLVCSPVWGQTTKDLSKQLGIDEGLVKQILLRRDMTPEQLSKVPKSLLPRMAKRLARPQLQLDRAEFRNRQYEDRHGLVPKGALVKAATQMKALQGRGVAKSVAGIPTGKSNAKRLLPLTAGVDRTGWVWKGPGNYGGRTRSLIIHPTQTDVMIAGSVGGGMWFTSNGGQQWQPVNDFMSNLVVTTMVFSPTEVNTIYVGTGEGYGGGVRLRGGGIYKSVNGLAEFNQLDSTNNENFHYVNRLSISPAGNVLLVATTTGLFLSKNGGETFDKKLSEPMSMVQCHPTDNTKAIASGMFNGTVYYTEDGGNTWNPATANSILGGRVEVTYAKANPNIVYAGCEAGGTQILRSTDGGKTFELRNNQVNIYNNQGWYNNVLWAGHPTNPNFLLVGGLDLYRSTNGGSTLNQSSVWWNKQSLHADHHAIVAHPNFNGTTNKTVFFCNDGGIYRTNDVSTAGNDFNANRGNGWVDLNNNYGVSQFYHAAGNPNTGTIICGAQDNGTLRYRVQDGIAGWTTMEGGDGGYCAFDPTDNNVFYSEYVNLEIYRSTNEAQSVEYICGKYWNGFQWVFKDPPYRIDDVMNKRALFIAPFILDPHKPARLLAGGESLWRTENAKAPVNFATGPVWNRMKPPIPSGKLISTITVDPKTPDTVWVGYEDGTIHRSTNATQRAPVWNDVTPGDETPFKFCHAIAVNPNNTNIAFAAFGGFNAGNLMKTTNGGQTWTTIAPGLPAAPVRSVTLHPNNPDFVYIGTEVGLFASGDGGANWSPTNEGPSNTSVDHLFWMNKKLLAVTHGRGLFEIDLSGIGQ